MSKVCTHRGCKRKVPAVILNNPQGESLCALHHGFQVRLNEDRINCTIIGCNNMAYSSGLCKNHTHSPHEVRMDLRKEHALKRQAKLKETLGDAFDSAVLTHRRLDILQHEDFNCLYCNEPAMSSMGPSPPHCCPICWNKIERC
jgi:hypothetical protein